jgi:hypothetical protein
LWCLACSEQICDTAEDEIRRNINDNTVRELIETGLAQEPVSNGAVYDAFEGNGSDRPRKYFVKKT